MPEWGHALSTHDSLCIKSTSVRVVPWCHMVGYVDLYQYALEHGAYGLEAYFVYTLLVVVCMGGVVALMYHDSRSPTHRLIAGLALLCVLGVVVDVFVGVTNIFAYILWSCIGGCTVALFLRYAQSVVMRGISPLVSEHALRYVLIWITLFTCVLMTSMYVVGGSMYEHARLAYVWFWVTVYAASLTVTTTGALLSFRSRTSVREREQIVIVGGIVALALVVCATLHIGFFSLLGQEMVVLRLMLWCIEATLVALLMYRTLNGQHSIPSDLMGASALTLTLLILLSTIYRHADTTEHLFILAGAFCVSGVIGVKLICRIHTHTMQRAKSEKLARYLANMNARLRDLDKQKTTFLSIATHQLRSPIAAITGYTSLIHDGSYGVVSKNLEEPLGRIFESGKRLALIVDDFLNVTRIEQGRMSYTMAACNIAKLVRETVEELHVIARQKGLTLDLSVAPDLDVRVNMDASKIKQVLSNLIDNAIKYTPEGSVTVSVEHMENHHAVMVEVRDTGIGIAPEEQSKLFQKFNRASNVSEVSVYGTGLGLYIAREIVRAHNGWIHLASAGVGKGSTFTIELPLVREDMVVAPRGNGLAS